MPDITVQVIINQSTHELSPEQEIARYLLGDIIDAFLSSKYASFDGIYWHMPPIGDKRSGFVHITDVPADVILKARTKLIEMPFSTITKEAIRRRTYHIDVANLPATFKEKILTDKEVTVTWTQAKPYIVDAILDRTIVDSDFQ